MPNELNTSNKQRKSVLTNLIFGAGNDIYHLTQGLQYS